MRHRVTFADCPPRKKSMRSDWILEPAQPQGSWSAVNDGEGMTNTGELVSTDFKM